MTTFVVTCDGCGKSLTHYQQDSRHFTKRQTPFCVVYAQPGSYSANYPEKDMVPINLTDVCPDCRRVLLDEIHRVLARLHKP